MGAAVAKLGEIKCPRGFRKNSCFSGFPHFFVPSSSSLDWLVALGFVLPIKARRRCVLARIDSFGQFVFFLPLIRKCSLFSYRLEPVSE